jgi:ketosteroid isomerase-like protein
MTGDRDIHVVPRDGAWAVKRGGSQRLKTYGTKEEAVRAGRDLAQKAGSHNVIHARDGRIVQSDSYGVDPFPARDARTRKSRKRRRFRLGRPYNR